MDANNKNTNDRRGHEGQGDGLSRRQRKKQEFNLRRRRGSNHSSNNSKSKRFEGSDQGLLKGCVICQDSHKDTSHQYKAFFDRVLLFAGRHNYEARKAIKSGKAITLESLYPPYPGKEEYTTIVNDVEVVDENFKELLRLSWMDAVEAAKKKYREYDEAMKMIYSAMIGQLCPGTIRQLQSRDIWEELDTENDPITLLEHLKEICYTESENPVLDFLRKMRKFSSSQQDFAQDDSSFCEDVEAKYEVLETGDAFLFYKALIKYTIEHMKDPGITYEEFFGLSLMDPRLLRVLKQANKMLVAAAILEGSNNKIHYY